MLCEGVYPLAVFLSHLSGDEDNELEYLLQVNFLSHLSGDEDSHSR